MARLLLPLVLWLASGCVIGNDKYPRPSELSPAWLVDRLRLLGAAAEPPEARPGDTVTFRALVADPTGETSLVVWLACEPTGTEADEFGCAGLDPSAISEDATVEELQAAGVIGVEPYWSPTWTVPDDILDELPDEDRSEGLSVLVQIAAFPESALESGDTAIDYDEVEVAFKRLVVSEALTPNENPALVGFTVDGAAVPDGAVVEVDAGQQYTLGVTYADGAAETYTYVNSDGIEETRTEEPYLAWYATAGTVVEPYTLWPYTSADWLAPDEIGESGTWWAVVRDRRGGMAWIGQSFTIR